MRMFLTSFGFALPFLATLASGPVSAQQEGTRWLDNYQKALEEAKRTQKPIFLEFRCEA